MSINFAEELKRAATNYAAKHGNDTMRSMLAAVTGVHNVEDVSEGKQMAALAALADGQMRGAFSGKRDDDERTDAKAIWRKRNGGADNNRTILGATEIDHAAIWARYNAAGRARRET